MTLNFQSGLFKDISSMLKNADDYNVIIKVGKSQDIKEFRAHSNILRSHSQHFINIIPADINKKNTIFTIIKPNITPTIFEIILKYIYTGEFNFKNKSGTDSFKLLVACNNLLLEELVEYLQSFLIEQHSSWIRQNFVLVLNTIFKSPILKKLQDYCIDFICTNPLIIITSSDFLLLDKVTLFYLLKRDILRIKETNIWEFLIKWGIKQTPGLENKYNQDEWTDKDYKDLKNTLIDLIPLIKFNNINSNDFYDKIRPYEVIIPINLYDEILEYHLVIKPKLLELKDPIYIRNENDPIYKFKLIYHGKPNEILSNNNNNNNSSNEDSFAN
ncbi:unnamed protein product [Rhizophagus irregularis]|nr:unnamed protein product [Rhizophagus irregularis]